MSNADQTPATNADEPGWALERLLTRHAAMRRDLATLRGALDAVARNGEGPVDVSAGDAARSLRTFCGNFCRFVHDHHSVENAVVFPSVLEFEGSRPGLAEVVERLEAEHRTLSGYVDEVEWAVGALSSDAGARSMAPRAMDRLSEHLEAHLRFEDENLAPALNALSRKVSPEDVGAPEPPDGLPG